MNDIRYTDRVSFVGTLCFERAILRPVLLEHLRLFHDSINPDIFMVTVAEWIAARYRQQGDIDAEIREILEFCERKYGSDTDAVDNLIAVSFLEIFLSEGEAGRAIIDRLPPRLNEIAMQFYRR
jgi:hypothetical protein